MHISKVDANQLYLFRVIARRDNRAMYVAVAHTAKEAKALAKGFIAMEIKDVKSERYDIAQGVIVYREKLYKHREEVEDDSETD